MGHPDNGLIQALMDGEIEGEELDTLRAHIEDCPECRVREEALEEASRRAAQALPSLDAVGPHLQEAKNRIKARKQATGFNRFFSLPKAASIALLLTAAAASALPGSPARRWITQGWQTLTQSTRVRSDQENLPGTSEDRGALTPTSDLPETGAGIPASTDGVEIWIHDLRLESKLSIIWVDGEEAWVYAGEGTRFNRVNSRLEAFAPPGAVRVEIPRSLRQVVVGLNGSVLLRKAGGEVEILAPAQQRTPSEIVFDAPGSTNAGGS